MAEKERWEQLDPEQALLEALDNIGSVPIQDSKQSKKRKWSEDFSNSMAVALADLLRSNGKLRFHHIAPKNLDSGIESSVPVRGSKKKKLDVVAISEAYGVDLVLSIKSGGGQDSNGRHGKNITGRTYELFKECHDIHTAHPHCVFSSVLFYDLGCCHDGKRNSSFSTIVDTVRKLSGRDSVWNPAHFVKFEAAFVVLYTQEDRADGVSRGVARAFNVKSSPPKIGRPKIDSTLSIHEMVDQIVELWHERQGDTEIEYSDPEPVDRL